MRRFTRECVENLEAYRVESPHYEIILNANENPWDLPQSVKEAIGKRIVEAPLNRYPEACFPELLKLLSDYTGVKKEQIICGCGSDELIAMINQAFVDKGDTVVSHTPSFAMYQIWTAISDAQFVGVPDLDHHVPDIDGIIQKAKAVNAKLIYLCNPNNPTGYLIQRHDIIRILEETEALVILDEAYMEFKGVTNVDLIEHYDNLLVMRTLSKAFGAAGIRLGYCMGNSCLIDVLYKVKGPYNINVLTQIAAEEILKNRDRLLKRLEVLNVERRRLYRELLTLPLDNIYPTASNFIYFETGKSHEIYEKMQEEGILIKFFAGNGSQKPAIRLTVGSPEENERVCAILKKIFDEENSDA